MTKTTLDPLARFCGPWSLDASAVSILRREVECCDWLFQDTLRRAGRYLWKIRAMVREMEVKLPEDEDLPFWREAVEFWEGVVGEAGGYAEPQAIPVREDRRAFAAFLARIVR